MCIIPNPSVNSNRSYSPEMLHSGQNWWFFCPPQPWTRQIWGNWKLRLAYSPETPNLGQNRWCFVPCDLEIWWMTLENNRASLICCFELCANYIAIGEFKLELQSGNAQFGSNSTIFTAVWPWNLMDDLEKQLGTFTMLLKALCIIHFVAIGEFKLDYSPETPNLGKNQWFFLAVWPCNLTMTLKNNRAPLLCYFKLCASFRSHRWFQTWATVRKRPIWVEFKDF